MEGVTILEECVEDTPVYLYFHAPEKHSVHSVESTVTKNFIVFACYIRHSKQMLSTASLSHGTAQASVTIVIFA